MFVSFGYLLLPRHEKRNNKTDVKFFCIFLLQKIKLKSVKRKNRDNKQEEKLNEWM